MACSRQPRAGNACSFDAARPDRQRCRGARLGVYYRAEMGQADACGNAGISRSLGHHLHDLFFGCRDVRRRRFEPVVTMAALDFLRRNVPERRHPVGSQPATGKGRTRPQ